jgi:Putative transposase
VLQVGRRPEASWVTARGARQEHLDGFDLHANLALDGADRARVEQLCRYMLRPPVAQERLARLPDGRVLVTLKAAWHDGTTHLCFAPTELLEKLAALIPRPRINLILYHGVLAPHAGRRPQVVAYGRSESDKGTAAGTGVETAVPAAGRQATAGSRKPRHWTWAALMRRVFEVDVLACPRCGGRMRLLATIEEADIVRRILEHLGLSADVPEPRPPRSPPGGEPELFG